MILDHEPSPCRLTITPQLDGSDVRFLAGFSRHAVSAHSGVRPAPAARLVRVARIWPGQPGVPSPWVPCADGCCLVLVSSPVAPEAAGQWLRFLLAEFLTDDYRLDGWAEVPDTLGTRSGLLIVEGRDVFEGELNPPSEPDDPGRAGDRPRR